MIPLSIMEKATAEPIEEPIEEAIEEAIAGAIGVES